MSGPCHDLPILNCWMAQIIINEALNITLLTAQHKNYCSHPKDKKKHGRELLEGKDLHSFDETLWVQVYIRIKQGKNAYLLKAFGGDIWKEIVGLFPK